MLRAIRKRLFEHPREVRRLIKRGMRVGEHVRILSDVSIDPSRPWLVEIEYGVVISQKVIILTHDASPNMLCGKTKIGKVMLETNCFIGARAIILPNVTVGERSVVGAGSVVTKNVPPDMVVAGNPARVICSTYDLVVKHLHTNSGLPHFNLSECTGNVSDEMVKRMRAELSESYGYSVYDK